MPAKSSAEIEKLMPADVAQLGTSAVEIVRRGFVPVTLGLGLNFLLMAGAHCLNPDPLHRLICGSANGLTAVGLFAVASRVRLRGVLRFHALSGFLATLVLLNLLLHHALAATPFKFMIFPLFQVGVGALLLSRAWVVGLLSASALGWLLISLLWVPATPFLGQALIVLGTGVLALLIHRDRLRSFDRFIWFREQAEAQADRLAQSLDQLERSQKDFQRMIERSPDAILIHRGGELLYVNPSLASKLGRASADLLLGTRLEDHVRPEDRAPLLSQAEPGHVGPALELLFLHASEQPIVLEVAPAERIEFRGAPAALVSARDVTERREQQKAKLMLADRMAAVGTLAAGLAHEINNPLAWLTADLDLLGAELEFAVPEARARSEELVRDCQAAAARISDVTRHLSAFSRRDGSLEAVDCGALLRACLQIVGNEIRHRARLAVRIDELPWPRADRAQLGQVFLNLLLNAIEAIEPGDAEQNTITVTGTSKENGAEVIVEDTGRGMDPETCRRAFDPFFTTKPVGAGTGLGLFFCRSVLQAIGGTILLESRPHEGTRVTVRLPAAQAPAELAPTRSAPAELPAPPIGETSRLRHCRVLIVDDEPMVGRTLARLLAEQHKVEVEVSAKEGLRRILDEDHDVVLCDLMMPEMLGSQLFEEVRKVSPERALAFIFITGGAFSPTAQRFLRTTTQPVLEKPIRLETLAQTIRAVARRVDDLRRSPLSPRPH